MTRASPVGWTRTWRSLVSRSPVLSGLASAMSAWQQRQRLSSPSAQTCAHSLSDSLGEASDTQILRELSPPEFERLVADAFRLQGFGVVDRVGSGAGRGVDLLLNRGRDIYLVQCRSWNARRVGVDVVRELYSVMKAHQATGGFVVSCGRYRSEARQFAVHKGIRLLDGPALVGMLHEVLADRAGQATSSTQPCTTQVTEPLTSPHTQVLEVHDLPSCPRCGAFMVKRQGSQGASYFWGCTTYPECKGTRPAAD